MKQLYIVSDMIDPSKGSEFRIALKPLLLLKDYASLVVKDYESLESIDFRIQMPANQARGALLDNLKARAN